MKKYNSNAERQKAYRQRLKSRRSDKSELRLIVDDKAILILKRLAARKGITSAEMLKKVLMDTERLIIRNMTEENYKQYCGAVKR